MCFVKLGKTFLLFAKGFPSVVRISLKRSTTLRGKLWHSGRMGTEGYGGDRGTDHAGALYTAMPHLVFAPTLGYIG